MNKRKCSFSICGVAILLVLLSATAWGYEKEIEQLSATMAEKIAVKGKKTVAVVDFTDLQGNVTELGRFLAEELSGSLTNGEKGFEVVNRSNLRQLIKEHELFSTGVIDPNAAMKLGEFSGIEALITGTITPFTENIRISTSVLDIKTAKVIDNEKGNIPRTKDIDELLGKEIDTTSSDGGTVQKTDAKPAQEKKGKGGNSGAFSDDFNAGPKPDWKPISGDWTMANGKYTVTNIQKNVPYLTILEGKEWSDFTVKTDIVPGSISSPVNSFWYRANICPRMRSLEERICFGIAGKGHGFNEVYWFVRKEGSSGEHIANVPIKISGRKSVNVKIEVNAGVFTAYINNARVNQIYDTSFSSGTIGLLQWYEGWESWQNKARIGFDNLEIKPLAD